MQRHSSGEEVNGNERIAEKTLIDKDITRRKKDA